jgi:hypothetical protein
VRQLIAKVAILQLLVVSIGIGKRVTSPSSVVHAADDKRELRFVQAGLPLVSRRRRLQIQKRQIDPLSQRLGVCSLQKGGRRWGPEYKVVQMELKVEDGDARGLEGNVSMLSVTGINRAAPGLLSIYYKSFDPQ